MTSKYEETELCGLGFQPDEMRTQIEGALRPERASPTGT
jgi:hypothetical protein